MVTPLAPASGIFGLLPDWFRLRKPLEDEEETWGFVILVYPPLLSRFRPGTLRTTAGKLLIVAGRTTGRVGAGLKLVEVG